MKCCIKCGWSVWVFSDDIKRYVCIICGKLRPKDDLLGAVWFIDKEDNKK